MGYLLETKQDTSQFNRLIQAIENGGEPLTQKYIDTHIYRTLYGGSWERCHQLSVDIDKSGLYCIIGYIERIRSYSQTLGIISSRMLIDGVEIKNDNNANCSRVSTIYNDTLFTGFQTNNFVYLEQGTHVIELQAYCNNTTDGNMSCTIELIG